MENAKFRVLFVDDSRDDVDLMLLEFKKSSFQVDWLRVDSAEDLAENLENNEWDIVICDYSMPRLDAVRALDVVRGIRENLPCIIVSGSIGEERAVGILKAGANDYLLKDNLIRLVPVVEREVREARERQRRMVAETELSLANRNLQFLKRFFPPQIVDYVMSGMVEDPFRWHRSYVTVLFIDLRGFTSFAENSDPEEVMTTLQTYYSNLAKIAVKFDGCLGHLAGDGVMFFFNDPVSIPDPEGNAVQMALEARTVMDELCEEWKGRGLSLNYGIGIASGEATIGGIGAEGFWDYTVVGRVTNLAARLCSEAKNGQILVPEDFLDSVRQKVNAKTVGSFNLKGFQRPVETFNIDGVI